MQSSKIKNTYNRLLLPLYFFYNSSCCCLVFSIYFTFLQSTPLSEGFAHLSKVHISTSFGFAGFTELQMIMLTESYRSLICPQGHCTVNEWMRQNMYQCLSRMVFW